MMYCSNDVGAAHTWVRAVSPGFDLHVPDACDSLRSTPNAVTVRVRIRRNAVAALRIARSDRILLRWQRVTNRARETVEL